MVRDHKVVGSNPVASTIIRQTVFTVCRIIYFERFKEDDALITQKFLPKLCRESFKKLTVADKFRLY